MIKPTTLPIEKILVDHKFQIRAQLHTDVIQEYSESYKTMVPMPPIDVFKNGTGYILADGFHRIAAAKQAGLTSIRANIHVGQNSMILKLAIQANCKRGVRFTNGDKHRAVELALSEWPKLSTRGIGDLCGVSHTFVEKVRTEILATVARDTNASASESTEPPKQDTRVGRDGKAYPAKPKEDEKKPETQLDKTGYPIPEELVAEWNRATDQANGWIRDFDAIHRKIMDRHGKDFTIARVSKANLESLHASYRQNLKQALPHAVCINCQGKTPSHCKVCNPCHQEPGKPIVGVGLGWVNKHFWDECTPSDKKAVREKAYGTNASARLSA